MQLKIKVDNYSHNLINIDDETRDKYLHVQPKSIELNWHKIDFIFIESLFNHYDP